MTKNILIVGTGVSGLTAAQMLLAAGHKVTLYSKEPAGQVPHTSNSAYAIWVPVAIDADPRVEGWANQSFIAFEALSHNPNTGVKMLPTHVLKTTHDDPWYKDKVAGFRHARADEIPAGYVDAHIVEAAPVIDPLTYMPWLRQQVVNAGGIFVQQTVSDLAQCPAEFDVIINCAGVDARALTNDSSVFVQSLQVLTVKNTIGLNRVVIDNDGPNAHACIVPHADYIKLGVVFDPNETEEAATLDIIARSNGAVPELNITRADVVSVIRAIRLERPTIRVEVEFLPNGRPVVHCYGQDGMGYMTSPGIAREILGYVDALN